MIYMSKVIFELWIKVLGFGKYLYGEEMKMNDIEFGNYYDFFSDFILN